MATVSLNIAIREKFIELRAAGMSFERIAKELEVSKPTALKLGHDLEQDVKRLQYIQLETLAEKYQLLKVARVEAFAKMLAKIDSALESVDFEKLPAEKLVLLKLKLMERLRQELRIQCDFFTCEQAPTIHDESGYALQVD